MSDYKELIKKLKSCEKDSRSLLNAFDQRNADAIRQAANAIEQLCTDVARLEAENCAKEQYIAETIGKLTRERDAAAEDIKKNWLCAVCKKRDKGNEWVGCSEQRIIFEDEYCVTCANFEWRGVQEAEHGNS